MSAERAPERVRLHPPVGTPIDCVLLHRGERIENGVVHQIWEAMPARIPSGFGHEPGWRVTVAVMPEHTTIHLCLPDSAPEFLITPILEEEDDE